MTRYLIKTTYLEGIHKGKEYYLEKGGYVGDPKYAYMDNTYDEKACKMVCAKYSKSNKFNRDFEQRDRAERIAKGKTVSKYPIYYLESFEPFAVEI